MSKKDPEGYKKLLVYKKADELHGLVLELAEEIKRVEREKRDVKGAVNKILLELADQLGRAARSPKSNIVEGWKRNTTKEYFEYLGFSIGSAEEIKEDVSDIIRGKYKELMGVKGIMGVRGEKGVMGPNPLTPLFLFSEIEKLPFYPLNPLHPFIIQIYLRTKELTMLLYKLQQSLEKKMQDEGTLSTKQKFKNLRQQEVEAEEWLKKALENLDKHVKN